MEFDTLGQTQISVKMTALTVPFQRHAIVDMSGVTYISSMGIGLLLSISTGLQRQGKRLLLLAPQQIVADVLRVTRLKSQMHVVQTEEELLEILAQM